jgi:hypothetical protein
LPRVAGRRAKISRGMGREGNTLHLDPETMRALGYQTVDMLVSRLSDVSISPLRRERPAVGRLVRRTAAKRLGTHRK